jgi:hypothetical protein
MIYLKIDPAFASLRLDPLRSSDFAHEARQPFVADKHNYNAFASDRSRYALRRHFAGDTRAVCIAFSAAQAAHPLPREAISCAQRTQSVLPFPLAGLEIHRDDALSWRRSE